MVILNCIATFGRRVLDQARDLGMTEPGWAWIVTDGITGSVRRAYYLITCLADLTHIDHGSCDHTDGP